MEIDILGIGAASMGTGLEANSKLRFLFRWWAVPIGLASMIAALPVAVLSFGCYGAAMLLGKVRPLRDAYEFLSRTYDWILDRLGQRVLRLSLIHI